MGFLELRQARGVHSRLTTGMPILNGRLFSEVSTLARYDGHLGSRNTEKLSDYPQATLLPEPGLWLHFLCVLPTKAESTGFK